MQAHVQSVHFITDADRQRIEQEHARLEHFLQRLRETCGELDSTQDCHDCEREKHASCQGRISSFIYDFMDLVAEHFENEEKIMCDNLHLSSDEYFRQHHAAHATLMHELNEVMHAAAKINRQGNSAQAIRHLHQWIVANFAAHARRYDAVLLAARTE